MRATLVPLYLLTTVGCGGGPATGLALSWTDNAATEQGFTVERKQGTAGAFVEITSLGVDAATYHDTAVTPGVEYCYRVRAYNASGNSDYSNEACGTAVEARMVPIDVAPDGQEDICLTDPNVFFCENWETRQAGTADFTSANYKSPGWSLSRPSSDDQTIVTTEHYRGTKAFQFQYAAGNNTGPGYMDLATGFPGGPYRTVYWRWMVKFSSNFVWSAVATKHNEFRLNVDGPTPQIMWFDGTGSQVTGSKVPKIAQYRSSFGDNYTFEQNDNLPVTSIEVDKWTCLEIKITMNTCDTCNDGNQEGWINGVRKFNYQNMIIDNMGGRVITGPLISGYWNCTQGDDSCTGGALDTHPLMYRWEDNYVGSTAPIGCPDGAMSPSGLGAPSNLQVAQPS